MNNELTKLLFDDSLFKVDVQNNNYGGNIWKFQK